MKKLLAGIATLAAANVASAAMYFQETENLSSSSNAQVFNDATGSLNPASGGYSSGEYVAISPAGYVLIQLPEGSLPAGTYNIADRAFAPNASRELDLYSASGLITDPNDAGFTLVGTVNNENNSNSSIAVEWERMYTASTGSVLSTITIPSSGGLTLRYRGEGTAPGSSDVLAFLTIGESLPPETNPASGFYSPQIPVPEPASIGLFGCAAAGLLTRRRAR